MISLLSIGKFNLIIFSKTFIFNENLTRVGAGVHSWNVSQYIWLDAGDYKEEKNFSGSFKYLTRAIFDLPLAVKM